MQIKVGITGSDLTSLSHKTLTVLGSQALEVRLLRQDGSLAYSTQVPAGRKLEVTATQSLLNLSGISHPAGLAVSSAVIRGKSAGTRLCLPGLGRSGIAPGSAPCYQGELKIDAAGATISAVLLCRLEDYVRGVLSSEMPASYHLEALKAQAVAARTYGLKPRISHAPQGFDVCDSYLCCQYFAGAGATLAPRQSLAIESTAGQILTYKDKPALALFSSCAGGHTENYQDCFADPETNQFPPEPIPYLAGVAEGPLPAGFPQEAALRRLWSTTQPGTADAWSPHFRWKVVVPERALEGQMHHVIETMRADRLVSPFVVPPPSGKFGHIDRFEVVRRGAGGTAITLMVHTSAGPWEITRELVIRDAFRNPDLKLARLKSARIYFDHRRNHLGLLSELIIFGLGWGHGVGMQQTGAQGHALAGRTYRQILEHYYSGITVAPL